MIIKQLLLENIRSYTKADINFSEGSTLLSGDIGSGKTTILLAIEFALFGFLRGDVEGAALLRNGEKQGSITLTFQINNKEIVITRNLRRTSTGIKQEYGIINNEKATPVQLKTKVLELLGYPRELLTKSKSLIFRYTVYTPQEAMKEILFEKAEQRLNTLRKVFAIDKYKQMQESIVVYTKNVRERKREIDGFTKDLDEKMCIKNNYLEQLANIENNIKNQKPRVDQEKEKVKQQKVVLLQYEAQIKTLHELKRQDAVMRTELENKRARHTTTSIEVEQVQQRINVLQKETEKVSSVEDITDDLRIKQHNLTNYQNKQKVILQQEASLQTEKRFAENKKQSISRLQECPTCHQIVTDEHKHNIIEGEDNKIKKLQEQLQQQDPKEIEEHIKTIRTVIQELQDKKNKALVQNEKRKTIEELRKRNEQFQQLISALTTRINFLQNAQKDILEKIKEIEPVEDAYMLAKKELDFILEKEKEEEIRYYRFIKEKEGIIQHVKLLAKEIETKKAKQEEGITLTKNSVWLTQVIIPLVIEIEKRVLQKIYYEFNAIFQEWFSLLVDENLITARLDEHFTPIITQNSHDMQLQYLSGGEKTAAALAYRLALHKVINDVITTIHTRDIIILDEPTDGFSSEQLDKMRDVLDQLNTKQMIMVSHEPKMETFVDNVIRVQKTEHESKLF
jgi:DNA repair protein SbcC/Rad50